eukprot:6481563-Alexandrium_andersonii.AAC.1
MYAQAHECRHAQAQPGNSGVCGHDCESKQCTREQCTRRRKSADTLKPSPAATVCAGTTVLRAMYARAHECGHAQAQPGNGGVRGHDFESKRR